MDGMPKSLLELVENFSKLPGIGKKTAERLAIYILQSPDGNVESLANSLKNVKKNISTDKISHCFDEDGSCVNNQTNRDSNILCIVQHSTDVFLIEKSGYKGHYHVLDGLISPLDGIMADDLNIDNLLSIVEKYKEIVFAFDPTPQADATTLYLTNLFKKYNLRISRLARGVPIGSSLDYIDELTLAYSLEDRVEIKEW